MLTFSSDWWNKQWKKLYNGMFRPMAKKCDSSTKQWSEINVQVFMSSLFNCNSVAILLLESCSIVDLSTPENLHLWGEKTPQIQVASMPHGHVLVYLSERSKSSSARAIRMHLLVSLMHTLGLLLPYQSLVHDSFQTARQQVRALNAKARVNAAWFYSNKLHYTFK